jgi:hypothetical protein
MGREQNLNLGAKEPSFYVFLKFLVNVPCKRRHSYDRGRKVQQGQIREMTMILKKRFRTREVKKKSG